MDGRLRYYKRNPSRFVFIVFIVFIRRLAAVVNRLREIRVSVRFAILARGREFYSVSVERGITSAVQIYVRRKFNGGTCRSRAYHARRSGRKRARNRVYRVVGVREIGRIVEVTENGIENIVFYEVFFIPLLDFGRLAGLRRKIFRGGIVVRLYRYFGRRAVSDGIGIVERYEVLSGRRRGRQRNYVFSRFRNRNGLKFRAYALESYRNIRNVAFDGVFRFLAAVNVFARDNKP